MAKLRTYQCPKCRETFSYAPSDSAQRAAKEQGLNSGVLLINCFHCPAVLMLRPDDGFCVEFTAESFNKLGGDKKLGRLLHDGEATENLEEEVERLVIAGDELSRTGKPREALTILEMALRLRKHDPQVWFTKGVCLLKLGDREGALAAIAHAAELKPDMVQAWNNLGSILCQEGRFAEAEPYFDRGLAVDPNYPKFYLGKANCLLQRGETEEGIRMLYAALEKDPNYAPARQTLAQLGLPA